MFSHLTVIFFYISA